MSESTSRLVDGNANVVVVTSCMVAYSWENWVVRTTKFKPKYAALFNSLIHNFWLYLVCDEFGYLSFNRSGAEILFQLFAHRYERSSLLITSNLPFSEWQQVFQGERMTAALLDRLTHHCELSEMNGES